MRRPSSRVYLLLVSVCFGLQIGLKIDVDCLLYPGPFITLGDIPHMHRSAAIYKLADACYMAHRSDLPPATPPEKPFTPAEVGMQ